MTNLVFCSLQLHRHELRDILPIHVEQQGPAAPMRLGQPFELDRVFDRPSFHFLNQVSRQQPRPVAGATRDDVEHHQPAPALVAELDGHFRADGTQHRSHLARDGFGRDFGF